MRSLFHHAYRHLSIGRPIVNFHIIYASRGDTGQIGESVVARSRQIENIFLSNFSSCSAEFSFIGAAELVELQRKIKQFTFDLPFLEHLATGKDSYVLLVRLHDYWKFVSDENGHLRRYLFDSNIRDFLGPNNINKEIAHSLIDPTAPDFWWLNNGVTILATNATVPGKTIKLQNIQIVNGLQTTETIYRHFQSGSLESKDRALLVKIIVSSESQVRDRIIKATNDQNLVETAALHATDKIQRNIEEILERNDWYYERRKNYYRNIGKPPSRFVTPLYLASSVIAIIFKNPTQATRLKVNFMRIQSSYDAIFSSRLPIEIWPILVQIYKQVDAGLTKVSQENNIGERFISTWRPLVSLIAISIRLKTFSYPISRLLSLRDSPLTEAEIFDAWSIVEESIAGRKHVTKPRKSVVDACCNHAAVKFNLLGVLEVGRRNIQATTNAPEIISEEFIAQVNMLLPVQPWKPGVHIEVASKLNCKPKKVSAAIQHLIQNGTRNPQHDGIVYSADGSVLGVDSERVPFTLEDLKIANHKLSAE